MTLLLFSLMQQERGWPYHDYLNIGKKSAVTTCTFSRDGKYIGAAQLDGSIVMWKSDGPYVSNT